MKISKPGPKRILLLLLISVLPFSILFMLSRADHDFGEAPYIGSTEYTYDSDSNIVDTLHYKIPEYSFQAIGGKNLNKKILSDHYVIFTTIQNSCIIAKERPKACAVFPYHIKELLYDEFFGNGPSYGDVKIVSIVTDPEGNSIQPSAELIKYFKKFDSEIWTLAVGDPLQVYSFPEGDSIYSEKRNKKYLGNRPYLRTMLLIDKNNHIRGYFGGKKQAEVREFIDRLRVLKREDHTTKEI